MSTISVTLAQQSSTASQATIRGHQVVIDRPEAKAGTDQGPMGGELLLAGLGGCFMSNLLAAVCVRQAPVEEIKTVVVGTLAESPARFTEIELQVSAQCQDIALLAKLVTIAERACLVANTLRPAVKIRITIVEYQ
jgi:putative redox protein